MTKIMYIPVDERPCNYLYPQNLVEGNGQIEMIVPPTALLGVKKVPANVEMLWNWINENISGCDYMVVSIDMLIYGGIVPSRLHYMTKEQCESLIMRLAALKRSNPSLTIYAFNLIMRVPTYNSSEEEPDYYGQYGERIFKYGWLYDMLQRGRAMAGEAELLESIKKEIPEDVLEDYTGRRKVNSYVNARIVELSKAGIIDFLVLPLDDCSEYGFSANEQLNVLKYVDQHTLHDRIYLYPGADEVGCSLTTRVLNTIYDTTPKMFIRYSSTIGPNIIPICEDRPLGESIKSQIMAAGGIPVDNSADADIVLMVNSPTQNAENMGDARISKDPSCYSMRNLREFAAAIQYYSEQNKRVAVADVAFCNGSDDELMRVLSRKGVLSKLYSYAGWNTSGNTLGTAISDAIANLFRESTVSGGTNESVAERLLIARLVEDWGYQAIVRQSIWKQLEDSSYKALEPGQLTTEEAHAWASQLAEEELNKFINDYIPEYKDRYLVKKVYFPWRRLFEVGFSIAIKS